MEETKTITSSVFTAKLAQYWSDFVDCDKRLLTEAPFLLSTLSQYKDGLVLDAAMGNGCESIFLLKKGFHVLSNEIDTNLIHLATQAAKRGGVTLDVTSYDWQEIGSGLPPGSVDAIILLGNSLCLLEDSNTIEEVLGNFFYILKTGGCLIVDERNFSYILEKREEILDGNFRYSGKYIYCGTKITGRPIQISNQSVVFGYFENGNDLVGELKMYPFKSKELKYLLRNVGFSEVRVLSDFQERFDPNADFYTYLAFKR